jgi:hypothetical protein
MTGSRNGFLLVHEWMGRRVLVPFDWPNLEPSVQPVNVANVSPKMFLLHPLKNVLTLRIKDIILSHLKLSSSAMFAHRSQSSLEPLVKTIPSIYHINQQVCSGAQN